MFTISNIIADIQRGILSHNLDEEYYSYRIIFFVNEGDDGFKHYVNASYSGLRKALEGIVRGHLSVTNSIVIAQTTVLKDGKCICLQNRSYAFSLDEYFKGLCGKKEKKYINSNYGGGKHIEGIDGKRGVLHWRGRWDQSLPTENYYSA